MMIEQAKHIHFVGIGGIGMSGLAKLLVGQQRSVSGSDLVQSQMVDDLVVRGIRVTVGQSSEGVPEQTDLLVYSSAVPESNPERVVARERGIKELSYSQALGEFSTQFSTIVVTGTHGKSTTTAMLGLILEEAGYDPTVLVGSLVPSFKDGNIRIGGGRFFVVEGCEYEANMLDLNPEMIVLTNVEMDHPDYYRDVDHVREMFQKFIDKLAGQGLVIMNVDDEQSQKLSVARAVTFGKAGNYRFTDRSIVDGLQISKIYRDEDGLQGELNLSVPGDFNMMNALAAISAAMELGVPFQTCKRALASYKGIWRRFERVGELKGVDIISDYGHHPTAIKKTLEATKEFFKGKRILLCYEPHQHARTKNMFSEFVEVFKEIDIPIILCEVYDVAGRNEDQTVSSKDIVEQVDHEFIIYAKDLDVAEDLVRASLPNIDVVVIMGAGDIDEVARRLNR